MSYVLYVARDSRRKRHNLGSILCIHMSQTLTDIVGVEECVPRHPANPYWLTGTPTLCTPAGDVLTGHGAFSHLYDLALRRAEERGRKDVHQAPAAATSQPSGRRPVALQSAPQTAVTTTAEAPPPAAAPDGLEGLWDSQPEAQEGEEDENDGRPGGGGGGKITQEDIARMAELRAKQAQSAESGRPRDPPAAAKD